MSTTTVHSPLQVETAPLELVTVDLYKDIHKGIRFGMFGVTNAAGSVDPGDGDAVAAVAERFHALVQLLLSHADHEDEFTQPVVERHVPALAEAIVSDHEELEAQMASLEVLGDRAAGAAAGDRRTLVHRWYLGLASFAADYLNHQAFEELEIAPALAAAVGADELVAMHQAIVARVPPDEMMTSLALMVPGMNLEDRVELLGGIQAGAPPEVFAGVRQLVESVLEPTDYAVLATRLGL